MSRSQVYQVGSLNLKVSPMLHKEGDLIRSVNVDSFPYGAKRKRCGYGTYLGTPDTSEVRNLFSWQKENGTQFWNYRFSGSKLYYSTQGTGAWTVCGNGTFNAAGTMTNTVLEDTLYICDGYGTINFSTTGTSFVNNGTYLYNGTSTTPAPVAVSLQEYQQRIYAAGTASDMFWSNVGTGGDWTNDSSSILIPGAGKLISNFKSAQQLVANKNSGIVYQWNGNDLTDLSTDLGLTSTQSVGKIQDYRIYLNRLGFFGYGGQRPELLSNAIERQIYNDAGEGIIGTTFDNAAATTHQYRYYCSIGTVTDDLTDETVPDAIAVYDFQNNEWGNYQYANRPTAWLSYKDASGNQQLAFGDSSGQCYQVSGTATDDNGVTIPSVIEGVITLGAPDQNKDWRYLRASFNPGAQAKVQVALADTYTKGKKTWIDLGDAEDGIVEYRFPSGSQSRLLFWKVYESSKTARFIFYGFSVEADIEEPR